METKAHYALVGFFAIALAAAGALFAIWLGQLQFNQEYSEYDVVFQGPVRGLTEASEVRFNGIKVGEVTRLTLDHNDASLVIARVRVAAQTPVLRDSVAQLEPQGITGLSYIQIMAGSPDTQPLLSSPGEIPRLQSRQAQLESLISSSEDIARSASEAIVRVNVLLSDENMVEFQKLLHNIRVISDDLSERDGLVARARQAIDQMEAAAVDVSSVAVEIERVMSHEVATAANETALASIEVNRTSVTTTAVLEDMQEPLQRFANEGLGDLTLAIGDLRRLVSSLEGLASEIEDDPTGFLSGGRPQEVEIPQ